MKFAFKKGFLFIFHKVIVDYKMKIKRVIEDLKFLKKLKKEKTKRMIVKRVKIYLGLSLVLLWAVWGQFIFG